MNRTLTSLFLALLTVLPAFAADGPRALRHEPLVGFFSDPPARPGLLQSSVRWGEVHVRGHETNEVRVEPSIEVDANLAARLTDAEIREQLAIRMIERDGTIEVEVEVDSTLDGFYSVALDVWVPRGTSLGLEVTDGGNIRVEDVGGEVEITNRNGSVDLSGLEGAAVVHARNGSIHASFDTVSVDLPMSFSTLNGSVDVTFPEEPSAEVKIRYNRGGVESDFPIESAAGEAGADTTGLTGRATRLLEGRLGGGGPRYYFHAANGTVYLRQAGR